MSTRGKTDWTWSMQELWGLVRRFSRFTSKRNSCESRVLPFSLKFQHLTALQTTQSSQYSLKKSRLWTWRRKSTLELNSSTWNLKCLNWAQSRLKRSYTIRGSKTSDKICSRLFRAQPRTSTKLQSCFCLCRSIGLKQWGPLLVWWETKKTTWSSNRYRSRLYREQVRKESSDNSLQILAQWPSWCFTIQTWTFMKIHK